jgi:hypothetical protein
MQRSIACYVTSRMFKHFFCTLNIMIKLRIRSNSKIPLEFNSNSNSDMYLNFNPNSVVIQSK